MYQSRLSNHTHTSPLWHVLIYLPLLRGSAASQSVWIIPCGPTTAVYTDRETLQLKRKDSSGPFSIGVLTLMDTETTPSCLRIRILCKHPAIPPRPTHPKAQGGGGNNWFHGCCGVSFGKVFPSLPLLFELELVEFKRKGYYLRLLPAQCTLWDNVLIGRDPPTAEVMLSLLRKAEGGPEVGGWLRPSRFKKGKNKVPVTLA